MADHAETLAVYRTIADAGGATVKGKQMPYTSLNGHMTSFLDPEGRLCLRLSKTDHAEFLAAFPHPPVMHYGAVMKEYVEVPEALISQENEDLAGWFARSRDYVAGLKPKPTKRK